MTHRLSTIDTTGLSADWLEWQPRRPLTSTLGEILGSRLHPAGFDNKLRPAVTEFPDVELDGPATEIDNPEITGN